MSNLEALLGTLLILGIIGACVVVSLVTIYLEKYIPAWIMLLIVIIIFSFSMFKILG